MIPVVFFSALDPLEYDPRKHTYEIPMAKEEEGHVCSEIAGPGFWRVVRRKWRSCATCGRFREETESRLGENGKEEEICWKCGRDWEGGWRDVWRTVREEEEIDGIEDGGVINDKVVPEPDHNIMRTANFKAEYGGVNRQS